MGIIPVGSLDPTTPANYPVMALNKSFDKIVFSIEVA
jgi:hypothetical protein